MAKRFLLCLLTLALFSVSARSFCADEAVSAASLARCSKVYAYSGSSAAYFYGYCGNTLISQRVIPDVISRSCEVSGRLRAVCHDEKNAYALYERSDSSVGVLQMNMDSGSCVNSNLVTGYKINPTSFAVAGGETFLIDCGGADPNNNSKLRDVIAKAKANNMPNDTIDRGIKKAAGDANSVNYVANTYEGYGPSGTAIIVNCLTDNKNRTASNVRNAFTKGGGNVGTTGCVSYMFDEKGQIIVAKEDYETTADDLMMMALDAGAEDFSAVREALEAAGVPMASAEVTMIPQNYVTLTDEEDIKKITRILDMLDEDDDVQAVYCNWSDYE